MPEPLQMPPILTGLLSIIVSKAILLGTVSVVMIDREAASPPSGEIKVTILAIPARILSISNCFPITPVETTKTPSLVFKAFWTSSAVSTALRQPSAPVLALACPALHKIVLMLPPFANTSRLKSTQAARTQDLVNTPAAIAGTSEAIKVRSVAPDGFSPTAIPAAL